MEDLVCRVKDKNGEYYCYKSEVEWFINEYYKGDEGIILETEPEDVFIQRHGESGFVITSELVPQK